MRIKQIAAILLIPMLFTLTGCASIVGQSLYPVTINSNPDGANILVKDEHGKEVFSGITPTTVTLQSGESYFHAKTYDVTFSRPGYPDQHAVIRAQFSGWYFGNIIFGGLIGLLIVDPITGKMWKLPKSVYTEMVQKTAMNTKSRSLQIVALNDVPERYKKDLVKLN